MSASSSAPILGIFSAPKEFSDPLIATIQSNAIASWKRLGDAVEVFLIGDDPGIGQAAKDLGAAHLPAVERNDEGTPRIDSIFRLASQAARSPVLCYVNADILLFPDILTAAERVGEQFDEYLMAGQRWDLEVTDDLSFKSGWQESLLERVRSEGKLHPAAGSDYFVFPKGLPFDLPAFALGRAGWDNWLIYAGRRARIPVVDATEAVTAVHQNHDYRHLPGGVSHYRLPETRENVRLAGGREVIFRLTDADWKLTSTQLERRSISEIGVRRWLETGLISRLGAGRIAKLVRSLFHPIHYLRYLTAPASERKSGWPQTGSNPSGVSTRRAEMGD